MYNYLASDLFDVSNGDLPRKKRLRPRKQKKEYKVDKGCRIGRSYKDFLEYLDNNPMAIECDRETGEIRTQVFYCDAGKPYQKGSIEVNHELIRRVLTDVDGRNRILITRPNFSITVERRALA